MCGIVAYLSTLADHKVFDLLHAALLMLQNRGYDSAGISTLQGTDLLTSKFASTEAETALEQLHREKVKHKSMNCGIGHTRWATHGAKTTANAHPHQMTSKNGYTVSVAHNGIIENYQSLYDPEYKLLSETDTELISLCIVKQLDTGLHPYEAFQKAVQQLEGTWAVVALIQDPTHSEPALYISKNGSPILLGHDDHHVFVASESTPFLKFTRRWLVLKDKCAISVDSHLNIRENDVTCPLSEYVPHAIHHEDQKEDMLLTPAPYNYWTVKEIMDQKQTLWQALNRGGRILSTDTVKLGGLDQNEEQLLELNHLVLLACGTSMFAAQFGAKMIKEISCFDTVSVFDASEFQIEDLPRSGHTGVVIISQSGETKDCHRVLCRLQDENSVHCTLGIVNGVGSLISRETDCGIYLNAGREVGVASTKSFTAQVVCLVLLALWFAQHRGVSSRRRSQIIDHLLLLPNQFQRHMAPIRAHVKHLIPFLANQRSLFILGRHFGFPIACEGALKIKELTYQNAEGYPGGGLKHGPFAVIDPGTPIILLMFEGPFYERMWSAAQETASRGAHVIAITNNPRLKADGKIIHSKIYVEESTEWTAALLSVLVFQWIAVDLALHLNNNPDFPRHLAKVVTVDG